MVRESYVPGPRAVILGHASQGQCTLFAVRLPPTPPRPGLTGIELEVAHHVVPVGIAHAHAGGHATQVLLAGQPQHGLRDHGVVAGAVPAVVV